MEPIARRVDLVPLRLLVVYGLGAMMVAVPVKALVADLRADLLSGNALAAVVAGPDAGFVLDRSGDVVRVAPDGSPARTAHVGPYRTPFGTAVGDRVVFGGIRCVGRGCPTREAELSVLDRRGRRQATVTVERTSGWPSRLDGLALVGQHGDSLWVNGGGMVFEVVVPPLGGGGGGAEAEPAEVAEVPWPGGEPCVIDGVLHDLSASGGTYERQGSATTPAPFDLRLSAWDPDRHLWSPVLDGTTRMPAGHNAYCAPDAYEIRDGTATLSRWRPHTGWHPPTPEPPARPGPAVATGVTIPGVGLGGEGVPAAVQVDDSGDPLFWCATTYLADHPATRCGHGPRPAPAPAASPASPGPALAGSTTEAEVGPTGGVHQYNLCSASCGGGVRGHSRDVVGWFVERGRPAAVSLNELCYDDTVHLAARLPDYTVGASYVALESTTNCPGAVKQFGNHLLVHRGVGPTTASWAQFPTQADLPCDPRTQECRGVACAATTTRTHVWCTAHLESPRHGEGLPALQTGELLELVAEGYGDVPLQVVAGDFNLERHHVDAALERAGFRSATAEPTVGAHDPPGSKQIDMVYVRSTAADDGRRTEGTTYCDSQASDHCYVAAGAVGDDIAGHTVPDPNREDRHDVVARSRRLPGVPAQLRRRERRRHR